ncbi:hypothetical protein A2U01_0109180, partial [Trifolium medium]|nr:hypothetical protein [Trifolium medium]
MDEDGNYGGIGSRSDRNECR